MNFDKFKKKTNSFKMISKCKRFDCKDLFKVLKVIDIVNYYTIEAIIYNYKNYHKVIFLLNDVDIFDDKLTAIQRNKMKEYLKRITLDKYFNFTIKDIFYKNNEHIFNLKFIGSLSLYGDNIDLTINTTMVNSIVNVLVLKEKIRRINYEEGVHFLSKSKNKDKKINCNLSENKVLVKSIKLKTIPEEKEV